MTDTIADMLTRIRNAIAVGKDSVEVPYSKNRAALAKVLVKEGFLAGVEKEGDDKPVLRLDVSATTERPITELHRISKPGRRVYARAGDIPRVLNGRGIIVVSTSSGVMSGDDARRQGIGGELMCKVW